MPTIQLLPMEKMYLREEVAAKFKENGGRLKRDTNRDNYVSLKENMLELPIIKEMTDKGKQSPYNVGESQLVSLFMEPKKYKYLTSFINTCYLYIKGIDQTTFFKNNKELVEKWESGDTQETDTVPLEGVKHDYENLKRDYAQLIEKFNILWNEKEGIEQALAAEKEQHRLTTLWYKPPPIEEEATLKDVLTFVNNVEFRRRIKLLIQSLMKGYEQSGQETVKLNPRLAWYKDAEDAEAPRQGVLFFQSKDGYNFGIDRVTWTGFDKEGHDIEHRAHELFSGFATTILGFQAQVGADFLNQLLAIDSEDYTAIIIYVGFSEGDTTAMARYPAFSEDMRTLGKNFVIGSRPWWINALDMERRKVFSWQDTIDSQPFTMGLSKPYQTIRAAKAPNERCFWIEVPIPSETAVMIIGIDLMKNE